LLFPPRVNKIDVFNLETISEREYLNIVCVKKKAQFNSLKLLFCISQRFLFPLQEWGYNPNVGWRAEIARLLFSGVDDSIEYQDGRSCRDVLILISPEIYDLVEILRIEREIDDIKRLESVLRYVALVDENHQIDNFHKVFGEFVFPMLFKYNRN